MLAGDGVPLSQRPLRQRFLLFPLEIEAQQRSSVFMHVHAAEALILPMQLVNQTQLQDDERVQLALIYMFFGGLLVILLYNCSLYLFTRDRSAFLGYRVSSRVMLISGDPVGTPEAMPELIRDACAFAEMRGLRIAALGASEALVPVYREAGLRSLYIGDEAIVETERFSLEGRAIRKVRQSVARLEAAGYSAEALEFERLDETSLEQLEHVSTLWRDGAAERGFTMAMDSLRGAHQAGSVVVAARDGTGAFRGFIHFVPSHGRPAMSLSFMRRDRSTPNGLMEFLVVRSVESLRERGVEEISLNFAAFGRWLDRPDGQVERTLGRVVALGDHFFQIESLHRFNVKFAPRWEPRYLVRSEERRVGKECRL